jgi:hypothetical protein
VTVLRAQVARRQHSPTRRKKWEPQHMTAQPQSAPGREAGCLQLVTLCKLRLTLHQPHWGTRELVEYWQAGLTFGPMLVVERQLAGWLACHGSAL